MKKKIMLVFGTRPEAIKLFPLHREIMKRSDKFSLITAVTGQHRELLDQVTQLFDIKSDYDLRILKPNQSLDHVTTAVLNGITEVSAREIPDMLIIQGDTTTSFAAALAAYYMKIPIGHVEAGLRSFDKFQPFPEEANRTFISHIADLNFCPTQRAAENLFSEHIQDSAVHVTGNTVIDALMLSLDRIAIDNVSAKFDSEFRIGDGRLILVTGHRRENFSGGLAAMSEALVTLATEYDDIRIVYSIHPNPNVRKQVESILLGRPNVKIIQPPDYFRFVWLMSKSHFIITDSGGIQEEAPSLKKPVLIARNVTERPEAVECGAAKLVGTEKNKILSEARRLLDDEVHYASMMVERNPFGDGNAAARIMDLIEDYFHHRF